MKRYTVEIPKAKSERMNSEPRILTILKWDGWGFSDRKDYTIPPEMESIDIDIGDEFEDVTKSTSIDALVFQINVTFYNSTKTRSETVQLTPKEIPITEIGEEVAVIELANIDTYDGSSKKYY